jgi:hypothetical protein
MNVDDKHKIIYARLLENYAMCKYGRNTNELDKGLSKVEKIFVENKDYYELCKLHYFKALTLQGNDVNINLMLMQECDKIGKIFEEYAFPDLERNFYNLLSNLAFKETNSLENYIKLKIEALTRDLVLYFKHFMNDWIDILHKIEDSYRNKDNDIINSMEPLITFLADVDLRDELYFINGVIKFLQGENEVLELSRIEDISLRNLANEYLKVLRN